MKMGRKVKDEMKQMPKEIMLLYFYIEFVHCSKIVSATQAYWVSDSVLFEFLSECLVRFHSYWVADMGFSLTLLSQFIEDMEAYAEV